MCIRDRYYFSDYYQISDNLSRVIPRFSSVIQHCIVVAIHLGFRQIYLLGCDTTNIVANVQTAMEESADSSYAYSAVSYTHLDVYKRQHRFDAIYHIAGQSGAFLASRTRRMTFNAMSRQHWCCFPMQSDPDVRLSFI